MITNIDETVVSTFRWQSVLELGPDAGLVTEDLHFDLLLLLLFRLSHGLLFLFLLMLLLLESLQEACMSVSIELLHHIHFLLLLRLFFDRFLLCEPQLLPHMRIIGSDIVYCSA